tara:strand:- start:226 stop:2139 length:1914 start_codon:yes stop_codon:yes gene_type:complete
MKKKKLLFQSDFALMKTGFGRNAKALLSYLYSTGKYEILHYCCGLKWSDKTLQRTPWKSIGTLPDDEGQLQQINRDPQLARLASYGSVNLDKIVKEFKPDVYIAVQDIWGIDFAVDKKWFKEITSSFWTTLDSLPILPAAVKVAPKVDNYWIWSGFATKALHKMGHTHVKTVHGLVDHNQFKKLPKIVKSQLRRKFNIHDEAFIIGFVFRNQLRKSVPNLLEGYKKFRDKNPDAKAGLLLHTHFSEGWNIPKLVKEYGINPAEILTTYLCTNCSEYEVKPFSGQEQPCRFCGAKNSQSTTHIGAGISEEKLNEVYNLMDAYCHPFTSGGQEIPIQEAKLAELITLVTNYSCGEDLCVPDAESIPLKWHEYREHGTEFIKASTDPNNIGQQLGKVYKMTPEKRKKMGRAARKWTIENFSPSSIGKFFEGFIDDAPFTEYDFDAPEDKKDPTAEIPEIKENSKWISALYEKILKRPEVDDTDDGHQYWMNEIKRGVPRQDIERYFRQVAAKENIENEKIEFSSLLSDDDEGKRIVYVMPENERDLFMSSSVFKSIKDTYPDYNLYVATKPEFFEVLDGNEYVHKVIPYSPDMENSMWLEGHGRHKGFFEIAFLAHGQTQRFLNYLRNGKDKIVYDLKCT